MTSTSSNRWTARSMLLLATALVVVAMFVPYGYLLVYPFRLFGTFIHETGHALAAVISGGQVVGMQVNLDTSGLAKTIGGSRMLISSAGYLGSIAAGAALLMAGRRQEWARPTLFVTGGATVLATLLFAGYTSAFVVATTLAAGLGLIAFGRRIHRQKDAKKAAPLLVTGGLISLAALVYLGITGALLTWSIGLVMGGGLVLLAIYGKPVWQHLTVLFLGVQLAVDGLTSVKHLFNLTAHGHAHNDAANMAQATGVPATFWAALWGVMGIAVVAGAFWVFWRDQRRPRFDKN